MKGSAGRSRAINVSRKSHKKGIRRVVLYDVIHDDGRLLYTAIARHCADAFATEWNTRHSQSLGVVSVSPTEFVAVKEP